MNAWFNANLELVLLIAGGVFYAMVAYQIWKGELTLSSSRNTSSFTVSRKTSPTAFWIILAAEFVLITGLLLVFYFVL
jgi:hypothetical protein